MTCTKTKLTNISLIPVFFSSFFFFPFLCGEYSHIFTGAVYVTSFSTIMLNTDLHNPQVKNKMTEKQFIDNTQHEKEDIPTEFLIDLFEKVCCEEIKFEKEDVFLPDAIKKGWFYLHSKNKMGRWKRRWVVLTDSCLYIFKKPAVSQNSCLFYLLFVPLLT